VLGGVQVASHGTPHSHDLTNCVRVRQDGKRSEATVVAGVAHETDQRYPRKAHASTHKHESCGGGGGDEQRAKRRP